MDTIVSPASALVSQAVGIVRVSGKDAFELAAKLLKSELPSPGTFAFRDVFDPFTGNLVDSGLILTFKSPNSFTGEDVVEFQLHGSPAVLVEVSDAIEKLGARKAEPGEFSLRAFTNRKATLPELELANALSNLKSPTSNNKGLTEMLVTWRNNLTTILAGIEAGISFPTDAQTDMDSIHSKVQAILSQIKTVLSSGKPGTPTVTLAGVQNAGKSTLFNKLVGFQRVVVSNVAGTTRDFLSMEIDVGKKRILLFDGPGLETESDDSGQLLYKDFINSADLVVWVDPQGYKPEKYFNNAIFAKSKSDISVISESAWINICSKTGQGLDDLLKAIEMALPTQEFAITQRQYDLLKLLENSLKTSLEEKPEELVASDIQFALANLSQLDGIGLPDEILSSIFSSFCIGK
ncbi:MAG: 50S ribosome-binding GTPase [Caldisericia bacterium]|nr:50S ribosome-binding GTPase [Caldisericia bacterium]